LNLNEVKKGGAQSIRTVIEEVFSRPDLKELLSSGRILLIWDSVVGAAIARHAQPRSFQDGRLTVFVDSSAWLAQIDRYFKKRIQEKLNRELKRPLVKKLVFLIGEVEKE